MRVFMLGWEFPPFISGGLGTACYGLTKALSRQRVRITFLLPKAVDLGTIESRRHVTLLSPPATSESAFGRPGAESLGTSTPAPDTAVDSSPPPIDHVVFHTVPARFWSPYPTGTRQAVASESGSTDASASNRPISALGAPQAPDVRVSEAVYQGDLVAESRRYAELCVQLARDHTFDLIHAHDWLTFPAGMAIALATGKPLIVHVHSTEFDRSGENIHQPIYDIERRGVHAAVRVIAVSQLTKSILEARYGINPTKVDVVYNGIENGQTSGFVRDPTSSIVPSDKIVLFLGRITMQKGPEYFVAAAKKVLEKIQNVKFVMAGHGDKIKEVIDLAAQQGIGHKVLFTGFLRHAEVDRIFHMADVYVMPSVSEPFGIAALEAISHDVPTIISRQSGVSEVLTHTLKVDFWDTDDMANKIIAVLKHPPLATTLKQHADVEIRRLTWDEAAAKCRRVYETVLSAIAS